MQGATQCDNLEEIIDIYRLVIGNDDRPTHHWAGNGEEGISTIDLTLATRPIMRWTTLHGSHATASDHEVIEWEFNADKQEEAYHVQVIGWNLAAMSKEDEETAGKLSVTARRNKICDRLHSLCDRLHSLRDPRKGAGTRGKEVTR